MRLLFAFAIGFTSLTYGISIDHVRCDSDNKKIRFEYLGRTAKASLGYGLGLLIEETAEGAKPTFFEANISGGSKFDDVVFKALVPGKLEAEDTEEREFIFSAHQVVKQYQTAAIAIEMTAKAKGSTKDLEKGKMEFGFTLLEKNLPAPADTKAKEIKFNLQCQLTRG